MTETQNKIPTWYWVVAGLILIWNLMGVFNFVQQVTAIEEGLQAMTDDQRQMLENTPTWVFFAFGLSVFSGVTGGLALLLRRKAAKLLFVVSLIAAAGQSVYSWSVALNDWVTYGGMVVIFTLLIFGMGFFAIWLSWHSARKNWLK